MVGIWPILWLASGRLYSRPKADSIVFLDSLILCFRFDFCLKSRFFQFCPIVVWFSFTPFIIRLFMACALHFKKKTTKTLFFTTTTTTKKEEMWKKKWKKKIWNTCKKIFFEISNTHKYIHHHFGLWALVIFTFLVAPWLRLIFLISNSFWYLFIEYHSLRSFTA